MIETNLVTELKYALLTLGVSADLIEEEVAVFLFHFPNFRKLKIATEDQLMDYLEASELRKQLMRLINFGRRIQLTPLKFKETVTSSQQVGLWLVTEMGDLTQEQLRIMCLNTKNEVIEDEVVFKGDLNSCIAHPREIFRLAVTTSANKILMVHNHPSGQLKPSQNDLLFSKRLAEDGKMMGIELLDSLIISSKGYLSLREEGILTE